MDNQLPEAFMTKYEVLRAERGDLDILVADQYTLDYLAALVELINGHAPAQPRPLIVTDTHLLKCPWCDEVSADLGIDEFGEAYDQRTISILSAQEQMIRVIFTGNDWAEGHPTELQHRACGNPVTYPEGWEVDYA